MPAPPIAQRLATPAPATYRKPETTAPAPMSVTRRRILEHIPLADRRLTLAGIPTALLEGGDGPPIVLLHGAGEFGAAWMRTFADLSRTHRLIVPDLPGHGESGLAPRLGRARIGAWLDALIAATCDRPPVLSGHLLGGAIAAHYASQRPENVDRLILVDTLGLSWFLPQPPFMVAMIGFVARPTPRTQDRLFRQCMVDLDALRTDMRGDMERLEKYTVERARTPELRRALRALMPAFGMRPIPPARLRRIAAPTTLICGRHGRQVSPRVTHRAGRRFGWPVHVVDGAADDPAVERPAAFLRAFRAALDA